MKKFKKPAFSLAEMMVVMLVMAIALAAAAPIMTKKMSASKSNQTSGSPWKWAENETDAFYGPASGQRAMIGMSELTAADNAKLIINISDAIPEHMLFKKDDTTLARLRVDASKHNFILSNAQLNTTATHSQLYSYYAGILSSYSNTGNTAIGLNTLVSDRGGFYNTAVGYNAMATNQYGINNVAIGYNALYRLRRGEGNVAIGSSGPGGGANNWTSKAPYTVYGSVAIGRDPLANTGATAIGSYYLTGSSYGISANTKAPEATGGGSIAIGSAFVANDGDYKSNIGQLSGLDGARALSDFAIAMGAGSKADEDSVGAIALGHYATATGEGTIALGQEANATAIGAIAIGSLNNRSGAYTAVRADGESSVAIGNSASAKSNNTIAIGNGAKANGLVDSENVENAIAIGYNAQAQKANSVAIGSNAIAENEYDIAIGTSESNVKIAGKLFVNGEEITAATPSDRRLKYVGKENTSGLEKVKQLQVFNYTYKNDDAKTPHVGVIAQDIQKVFPDAVKKGSDGFLSVRMEDMFYAVVNAIKELDKKLTAFIEQIQNENKQLKQDVKQLKSENAELKARLDKLEAKMK